LINRAALNGERARFSPGNHEAMAALWRQVSKDAEEAREIFAKSRLQKLAVLAQAFVERAKGYKNPGEASTALNDLRSDLVGSPALLGEFHLICGDLEAQERRWAAAQAHYRRAVELFSSINRPLVAAQSQEICAAMAEKQHENDEAASLRAAARQRRRELAEIDRYRATDASEEADKANAAGLEQFSAAGSDMERLRCARDAFRAAHAAPSAIRWYYALNLTYAYAALKEWRNAVEALESSLRDGPQWWRGQPFEELLRDLRGKELDHLQTLGTRELSEGHIAEAVTLFADALSKVREYTPGTIREATIRARALLAHLENNDRKSAVAELVESLAIYRRLHGAEAGNALGLEWAAALNGVPMYRRVDAHLEAIATRSETGSATRREIAQARQGLASYLDQIYATGASWAETAALVIPIALELAGALIPADPSEERWSLFTEYIPRFRDRVQRELGWEVAGVRVRPGEGLSAGGYSVFLNEARVATGEVPIGSLYCQIPGEMLAAQGGLPGALAATHPRTERAASGFEPTTATQSSVPGFLVPNRLPSSWSI
jgi:hypothetical protein